MELLKKNLGLILYTLASLVLGVFIMLGTRTATRNASEHKGKVDHQVEFFTRIQRNEHAISKTNVKVARQNQRIVDQKFFELRSWLSRQYSIPQEHPPTSIECMRILQAEVRRMQLGMQEKRVALTGGAAMLSFKEEATRRTLPAAASVPGILRSLKVVREVTRLVAMAEINELTEIKRLNGLGVKEEDLYTITSLHIAVISPLDEVQRLLNLLSKDSRYLFFLRNVQLETQDQAAGGKVAGFSDTGATMQAGGSGGFGGFGAGDQSGGTGFGDASRRVAPGGRTRTPPTRRTGPDGDGAGDDDDEEEEITKGDLRVFTDPIVGAKIWLDLVEFRQPTQEEE